MQGTWFGFLPRGRETMSEHRPVLVRPWKVSWSGTGHPSSYLVTAYQAVRGSASFSQNCNDRDILGGLSSTSASVSQRYFCKAESRGNIPAPSTMNIYYWTESIRLCLRCDVKRRFKDKAWSLRVLRPRRGW